MAIIVGVISALPLWLVFFNIKERPAFASKEKPKLIPALKAAFKNRPFVFGAVIYLLTWICMDIIQAVLLFFINYIPNSPQQPESALWGIRILMGLIPAVLLMIAIIFAIKYPLNREQFGKIVDKLKIRRGKA